MTCLPQRLSAWARRIRELIAAIALGLAPHLTQGRRRWQLGEVSEGARLSILVLALSATGIVAVYNREGYSGKAYPDPVLGTQVMTIGFGSTENVKQGDTTTPIKAINRTLREVQVMENQIKRCAFTVKLRQGEYDTYVELAHNIGAGAFCRSTILKHLAAEDYVGACNHILDWKYVGDVDCSKPNGACGGLWKDRLRMNKQCLEAAS